MASLLIFVVLFLKALTPFFKRTSTQFRINLVSVFHSFSRQHMKQRHVSGYCSSGPRPFCPKSLHAYSLLSALLFSCSGTQLIKQVCPYTSSGLLTLFSLCICPIEILALLPFHFFFSYYFPRTFLVVLILSLSPLLLSGGHIESISSFACVTHVSPSSIKTSA